MNGPKVSILIPSYKPNWFREALLSALNQTYGNIEIIVSDDCPTDAIRQICDEYGDRISYICNPNPGRAGFNNLLHLLSLAQGEYIKYLFDDDALHPECVAHLAAALSANNQCAMAFSLRNIIDEQSRITNVVNYFGNSPAGYFEARNLARVISLECLNPVGELTTIMMRTEDARQSPLSQIFKIGDDEPKSLGDAACYLNLAQRRPLFHYTNKVLSSFRISSLQNGGIDSPVFSHGITEWLKVMRTSVSGGLITRAEATTATHKFREKWMRKYPAQPALQELVRTTAEEQLAWLAQA